MLRRISKVCMMLCLFSVFSAGWAQDKIVVQAVTDKTSVSIGEPVILQVQVQGTDQVTPDNSLKIDGMLVVPGGGQATNREYTTSINGRIQRQSFHGYVYSYRLMPLKAGAIIIPALSVKAGGQVALTRPIRINVTNPKIDNNFHVTMKMDKKTAYVGEEIKCTLTVYFDKRVDDPWIYVPEFSDPSFKVDEIPVDKPDRSHVKVMLNNKYVLAKVGQEAYKGKNYYALKLTRYLQPQRPGMFSFNESLASFNMVKGYKTSRRRSPFSNMFGDDDFFDDPFFSGRQPVVERVVARTDASNLTVLQVPEAGRPANFSGLIGKYSIAAKVEPEQAAVGQPMTLTVMIAGDGFMENVRLPNLNLQDDIRQNFRVSDEADAGKMISGVKVFTRTIRAKNADIKEFPPIELNFFNSGSGNYDTAKSKPFGLTITAAKKVTINDVVGAQNQSVQTGSLIESASGGIRHNYAYAQGEVDEMVCGNLWEHTGFLLLVIIPPVLYLVIVGSQLVLRRRALTSGVRKAGNALKKFRYGVKGVANQSGSTEIVLVKLQEYFASRIGMESVVIGYAEVQPLLDEKNVTQNTQDNLKKIFDHLDACRYGGGAQGQVVSEKFLEGTLKVMENLDKQLG